ncbi:hypothetical protein CISIN_1g0000722mg, partial [Citrus sinensis]
MLRLSSTVPSQIRFLLQSLNEANADSVFRELCQFIEYGIEGSTMMLQTCMDHLNLHGTGLKNPQLESVVASVFKYIMDKPNFSTVFSQSVKITEINEQLLENLSDVLNLSLPERIGIGLALSDSENLDALMCGKNFCMAQIERLCANPVPMNSAEQIQNIIMFLQRSSDLSKHVDSLMQILSLLQSKDHTQFVLNPVLPDELHDATSLRDLDLFHECRDDDFDDILAEMEKEMSMGDVMNELGYGCSADASQCKEILSLFTPLTEITLSRILGAIARTHAGLEDNQNTFSTFTLALGCSTMSDLPPLSSWNVDVLVKAIKQLAPNTNWIRVVENLDYEGFYIPTEEAFSFFMSVYKYACQEPFPLHAVCGSVWKNTEGQLSFLRYAVASPPEVFTFAHSARQLPYVDAVPGLKLQSGQANHAWLCLDLLDVLCQLSEMGHASFARSMLEYPLKQCPEMLLLGMAHINTAYNLIQYEVSFAVFPMIIKSTMSNGMILHIWHVNPNIVLRGFVDAQNMEPDCTIRILEICQELKILSSVLEMIPSPFAIRLAVIASQKELVDLEKWLSINLSTYKDVFFEECLKFVKEVQFGRSQDFSAQPFHHSGALLNLYMEKIPVILKLLKAHIGLITSTKLSEEIEKFQAVVLDSTPRLQNGEAADSSTSEGYADDIEAEANSYFHQMFSGQLTIEAMVQMLARFKESSVKREHSIFECMIGNLFEEYRFFPKYPERQLRIAAVLF